VWNNNHLHCVSWLKERFDKQFKLVDSHMEALLNVSIPLPCQQIKPFIRKCVVCKNTSGRPYTMPDPLPLIKSSNGSISSDCMGLIYGSTVCTNSMQWKQSIHISVHICCFMSKASWNSCRLNCGQLPPGIPMTCGRRPYLNS